MRIGKFRRRIVSKSPFSDAEKPDARDDGAKVSSLTEDDEQKEDDIARAKSRVVNPLFSLRMLLRRKGVVLAAPRRIVLRHFHERFPIAWTKRNAYTHTHTSVKQSVKRRDMTGGGKQPKVDHTQTDSMNLKVLRRDDPSIQTILGSASSIAMYELDMQTTKWHRKNVEGSLFVVERKKSSSNSSNSRFQFIVLNRLSDERFVESIAKDAEFEMSEKYLLYKTDTDEVNGVWFYDEKEQTNIYEIIQRAQEMERSGIYANNGEEGGGGGGTGTTKSGGSSIDDVASLFQSAMSGFGGGAEKPAKPKPKKETNIAAGKKKSGGVGSSAGENSSGAMITRDAIRNAMLRLATNDQFLDAVASELNR